MKNICDWKDCYEIGTFKAPNEKDNSKNFRLLCKKHIKEFNKSWNYFDGMSQDEISAFLKSDLTWHNKFKIFNDGESFNNYKRNLSEMDKDAFAILGLESNSDWFAVQKKFKILVKKFHPDKNSGNKIYEDKLKKITLAYSNLKMIFANNSAFCNTNAENVCFLSIFAKKHHIEAGLIHLQ